MLRSRCTWNQVPDQRPSSVGAGILIVLRPSNCADTGKMTSMEVVELNPATSEAAKKLYQQTSRSQRRLIWRSGGLRTDFIEEVQINRNGQIQKVSPMLRYNTDLASELHEKDRVHTYGSFYIADLSA